ncbi:SpoIIE family protein phosphatase, partial [Desulfobacterales bacterium HSG17]|nr:SpoIIE family protein phosphatase [Desulfobacterales bacterium HSG17]
EIIENKFDSKLSSLDDAVAQRLIDLIIKNEDAIDIEQISSLIGGYRSSFIQIELWFLRLGLEHFKSPMQEQEHPLIAGLDDLHLRLRTLTASTPVISEHGKQLIELIKNYQELVPKFHHTSAGLQIMLEKMADEREKLLLIMEQIDIEIEKKTDDATLSLNKLLSNTLTFNLFILLGILPVVILGGITAYSIKKPVQKLIEYIDRLSKGDTPDKINEEYRGEFNHVRDNLNILIEATSNVTLVAEEIAAGNLNILVRNRSENDRLMQALNSMIQSLGKLQKETDNMICAVGAGQLNICGNADEFQGGWRTLVNGFNELIKELSTSVATSISLTNKMELARRIQTSLLPESMENIHPDLEIAAEMITADQVGGDYYDISYDREKNLWISIGDVSGHGVTPGLIMMIAQTIHTSVINLTDCDPSDAIIKTNEIIYKNVHERLKKNHFMTFMTMKYKGRGWFQYAGAHLSMIVFRCKINKCELVTTGGMYLNI